MLSILNLSYRTIKTLRGCCLTVVVALVLVIIAGCASLLFMAGRASAMPPDGPDIMLVLDQSQSLWELGGVGSDPNLLRIDAARLLINTLGVDQDLTYRLGIVNFGTNAELVAPLTSLIDTRQRQTLMEKIANPEPMGWTDVNEALDLAHNQFIESGQPAPNRQPTLILLTDGRPETEDTDSDSARQAYLAELEAKVRQFAEEGITVYTILISNQATDTDSELQGVYRPLWIGLSREFENVHFEEARTATDLPALYHTIAVALQGARTAGPVLDGNISGTVKEAVEVEPGLYRVTFVIRKSEPDLKVNLVRPDDSPLQADVSGVRFAGDRLQEVWSIRHPEPGTWRIILSGQGWITVWKDYVPAPPTLTPTPSLTATATATRTNTPVATHTPTAVPTNTPTPTPTPISIAGWQIISPEAGGTYPPGSSIAVRVRPPDEPAFPLIATLRNQTGAEVAKTVLQPEVGGDLIGEIQAPDDPGDYVLILSAEGSGNSARGRALAEAKFQIVNQRRPWVPIAVGTLVILGLIVTTGSYAWSQRSRSRPAPVEGQLRLVRAPEGEQRGQRWDLGLADKHRLTVGGAGSDVSLTAGGELPSPAAEIMGRRNGDQDVAIVLRATNGHNLCHINGRPVRGEQPLWDRDEIQIGEYVLRYENVSRPRGSRGAGVRGS